MSALYAPILTVCGCALICVLASGFVTDGGVKRVLSLVMGAFIVASLVLPIQNAVRSVSLSLESSASPDEVIASSDEIVQRRVLAQTAENLEKTLGALLLQNGVEIRDCEVILADAGERGIIISQICIYLDKDDQQSAQIVREVTCSGFGIEPLILTETE